MCYKNEGWVAGVDKKNDIHTHPLNHLLIQLLVFYLKELDEFFRVIVLINLDFE